MKHEYLGAPWRYLRWKLGRYEYPSAFCPFTYAGDGTTLTLTSLTVNGAPIDLSQVRNAMIQATNTIQVFGDAMTSTAEAFNKFGAAWNSCEVSFSAEWEE